MNIVEYTEFLVYINAETGEEEYILIIYNTPNGTLTMWDYIFVIL